MTPKEIKVACETQWDVGRIGFTCHLAAWADPDRPPVGGFHPTKPLLKIRGTLIRLKVTWKSIQTARIKNHQRKY